MKPVHVFNVIPSSPPALEGPRQLAYNLGWAWNHDTIELFRRLDSGLWESTRHNPLPMLGTIDQAQLAAAAPCGRSGLHGYTVRVLPFRPDEPKAFLPGLITWADAK